MTGVQTCALPICHCHAAGRGRHVEEVDASATIQDVVASTADQGVVTGSGRYHIVIGAAAQNKRFALVRGPDINPLGSNSRRNLFDADDLDISRCPFIGFRPLKQKNVVADATIDGMTCFVLKPSENQ